MKKTLLLSIIFLFLLSTNVMPFGYFQTGREIFLDFDQEINNAALYYGPGQGEMEYLLTPLVYYNGETQGIMEHLFLLGLGVGENTEISGIFLSEVYDGSNDSPTQFFIGIKNQNEIKDWKVAALAGYNSLSDGNETMDGFRIGLLTDYVLSEKLTLYNNLVYFKIDEFSSTSLTNGLSYEADEKTRFLISVFTSSVDELDITSNIFSALLEYELNDDIIYTGKVYKDSEEDNYVISNQIKLELMDGLSLTGLFTYNSSDLENNSIAVGAEKEFEKLSLKGAYWTELGDYNYSKFVLGLGYKF
ncbi:MAG: hypothetical protein GX175_07305 [Halanaerobiaceae bacterium]|nr:hypothetical protein [Halanaerobiaceae bacterium]